MIQAEIATQYPTLDESENLGYTNTIPTYTNTSVAGCNTDLDVTVKENFITDLDKKEVKAKLNSIKQNKIEKLLSERITNLTPEEILYLSIHLNSALKE